MKKIVGMMGMVGYGEAALELLTELTKATLAAVAASRQCEKSGAGSEQAEILDGFHDLCQDVPQPILAGCMLWLADELLTAREIMDEFRHPGGRLDDAV